MVPLTYDCYDNQSVTFESLNFFLKDFSFFKFAVRISAVSNSAIAF